jgi:hypothetical protein
VPLMMMMMNLENHLCHQTHLEVYNGCETWKVTAHKFYTSLNFQQMDRSYTHVSQGGQLYILTQQEMAENKNASWQPPDLKV